MLRAKNLSPFLLTTAEDVTVYANYIRQNKWSEESLHRLHAVELNKIYVNLFFPSWINISCNADINFLNRGIRATRILRFIPVFPSNKSNKWSKESIRELLAVETSETSKVYADYYLGKSNEISKVRELFARRIKWNK